MRVAYIVPAPGVPLRGPSGASAHVRDLAHAWSRDHDLRLYVTREEDERGRFGRRTSAIITGQAPWPRALGRWRVLGEVGTARRMAERVMRDAWRDQAPDVLVERHSLFSDAGWRVQQRLGVPWVLEVNAPATLERRLFEELRYPTLAARWQRSVLLAAPVIVTVSQWLARWLQQEIGCRRVHWVPNGVTPYVGDRARGRALLGVSGDQPLIGFVGSARSWHGVDRLGTLARGAGARLAVIGPTRQAAIPGCPEDTVFPGFLEDQDLADAVAALDVGLAPYRADAPPWFCPLKLLDYRAQGTPIVASDIGDARALTERSGSVVPADDTDAQIDAIRDWLGRRCIPRVRSWSSVGRQVLGLAAPQGAPDLG